MSDWEYEYTVQVRKRTNQRDESGNLPVDPNWGEWSQWSRIHRDPFRTLAGAAMSCASKNRTWSEYREPRAPIQETESRVVWRKVPKTWTPIHEEEV